MSDCRILVGDCRDGMATLPDQSVQTCVTSPPYFGLRDYGHDGQIGLEPTPDEFVTALVSVFREVRRVLKDDGTVWLNLGDSYARQGGWSDNSGLDGLSRGESGRAMSNMTGSSGASQRLAAGLKTKDLIGIPWRVAFALQADGWYLRQDIIWHKPNPMPESVQDRCTKAHEYLFLLAKSERYFYDADAISEPLAPASVARGPVKLGGTKGDNYEPQEGDPNYRNGAHQWGRELDFSKGGQRNRRSVWTVNTKPYSGAHFATFPPELIEPCILAGSRPGDVVLDPFGGSGTTGAVAVGHGRRAVLCELNPEYAALAVERVGPMFCTTSRHPLTGPAGGASLHPVSQSQPTDRSTT
jgi:DNA modification methylase